MAENKDIFRRTSERLDSVIGVFSPRTALMRKACRFSYDAVDGHRTRKKRRLTGGTGDSHLTDAKLDKLREIARDMGRNNPLVKGILKTERDGVIGSAVNIQARTEDEGWNTAAEAAFKAEMIDQPCDVTGRFNFNKIVREMYLSYRRDGDVAAIFTKDRLQLIEGDQIGTPYGQKELNHLDVSNGVAFSKKTGRLIGYFVGKPDQYGYINSANYKNYKADSVYFMFNPDRFSFSRGEPIMTSSIDYVDKLCSYIDAELVAAKVNACFSMFVAQDLSQMPAGYTGGVSSTGLDADSNRLEKIEPGIIQYGNPGEKAYGIGQVRPGTQFDPFILRMLTFIGRPLCMPLMLITLDFAGATFMNARIAYQKCQEAWQAEQENVVKPFISRVWRWKIADLIERRELPARTDWSAHEVIGNRWPYVDPYKEAMADKVQLANNTTNRTRICARQGTEFKEIAAQREKEELLVIKELPPAKPDKKGDK